MRLTGLTLANYGNFKSERITFDPAPGVVNLLMAPNGGGKSVLRSAFCDLLFGIGGQSPMGFRYGYGGMRVMVDAVGPDGQPFSFGRRKGRGNTLIDADGTALDPETTRRLLGPVNRERLERLFALDTDRLRKGQEDLLTSGGDFADALVSGSGGPRDLRAVRRALEAARDGLAPRSRVSSRPFYIEVDKFVAARKRKEASLLRPDKWKKMQAELDAARQGQEAQNKTVQAESASIARMERVRRVRPCLAAVDVATSWLEEHPDAPVLDGNLKLRLDDARFQIITREQHLRREHEAAAHFAEQLGAIVVDDVVLAEAEEIDRLVGDAGAAHKARSDLEIIVLQMESQRAKVAHLLRDVGSTLPVEQAADAVPLRAVVSRTRRLIKDYAARQQATQSAAAQIVRAVRDRDQALADQAELGPLIDVSELDGVVKEIRSEGNPVVRLRDVVRHHHHAVSELASLLVRVPGWADAADRLIEVAVFPAETYQRYADAMAAARSDTEARSRDVRSAEQSRDDLQGRVAALTGGGAVPDAAALAGARNRRDAGWGLIYRRAFTANPPAEAEERAFADPLPLPSAYERAVLAADAIADQRLQDADAVARVEAAKSAVQEAETRLQVAEAVLRQAVAARTVAEAAWRETCRSLPLGSEPTLKEVQGFLVARDKVIDAQRALSLSEVDRAALELAHERWAVRLGALLGVVEVRPLPDLLALADARVTEVQKASERRGTLKGKVEATERSLVQAREKQHQADAELLDWWAKWAAALAELGRPEGEDPGVTDEILQVLEELAQAHKDDVALTERVSGMRADIARFTSAAAGLAARTVADLEHADAFAVVSTLRLQLQTAKALAGQRDILVGHLADAKQKAGLAQQQLDDRQDELRAILALIGAADVEEADARLVLAAERARQAANLAEAQTKLAEAGDLLAVDRLRAEVAAVPSDEIALLIQEAEQRRDTAQLAAQEAAAAVAALTQQMNRDQEATEAVDAAADQQAAVAKLGRVLEEALLYHLAAEMLGASLAAVEKDSEPAMLRRIGTLFGALTGGAYTRVMTDADDDGVARLSLIQGEFPDERQAVGELSEGTRDQLYLALRLAAIEFHVASAPALPFIGDDILQTFDDARALAALRVLRDVSKTVQVILLTHHRHVLDLAQQLPSGAVHVCRVGTSLKAA